MCTAIADGRLFGRTLDLEHTYGEQVVILPRSFPISFMYQEKSNHHHAMIGMAHVSDGIPLYYDAINEKGVGMAALHFPHSAVYHPPRPGVHNVASFEVIPWILSQCTTLTEATDLLRDTNVTGDSFSPTLPSSPLHWLIADASGAVTVESVSGGLRIYENPVGVMTNEPEFPYHMTRLTEIMQVTPRPPHNHLCPQVPLLPYARGMGSMGLPGDFSSVSRFLRCVYAKTHTTHRDDPEAEINRFFHVMDTVAQPEGCAVTAEGRPIATVYTSCADLLTGAYHFTTYRYRRIRRVDMSAHAIDGTTPLRFPIDGRDQDGWDTPLPENS